VGHAATFAMHAALVQQNTRLGRQQVPLFKSSLCPDPGIEPEPSLPGLLARAQPTAAQPNLNRNHQFVFDKNAGIAPVVAL